MKVSEYLTKADNVYRTQDYIVIQRISIAREGSEDPESISRDVYVRRTRQSDAEYEAIGRNRRNIDGKRLPTTLQMRRYIE